MGRILRRVVVAVAAFWWVLGALVVGVTGVAHAAVDGITVTPRFTCLNGGVAVTNDTDGPVEVRVDLDGSPAFSSGPWYTVESGGSRVLTGPAPTSGAGVYTVYLHDAGETLLATETYTAPGYCDDIDITYVDHCDTVTATVTNHYGSAVTISFVKVSGSTYELASLSVPNGQTATVEVPINADVYDVGAYLTNESTYLNKYVVQGPDGDCPTPTPTPASTTPAATNLASTGNGSLVPITVAGVALILAGIGVIIGLRRVRFR